MGVVSGVAIVGEVVSTVPIFLIAPLWTFAFLARFAGVSAAIGQGHGTMPWFPRVSSWVLLGAGVLLLDGGSVALAILAVLVALDAAGGFIKRPIKEKQAKAPRAPGSRRNLYVGLGIAAYLGLVAAFHFLFAVYLPYGVLVTWSLLALAFAFGLRLAIVGPKALETHLRAPESHRRHERREKVVVDPARVRAEEVLLRFRARGDAGPFMDLVREAAQAADLPPSDLAALEARIAASFARAGTGRDQDIVAALEEVERFLSLRSARPAEVRP